MKGEIIEIKVKVCILLKMTVFLQVVFCYFTGCLVPPAARIGEGLCVCVFVCLFVAVDKQ